MKSDVEGIEHHVHKNTIASIRRFVSYATQHPSWGPTLLRRLGKTSPCKHFDLNSSAIANQAILEGFRALENEGSNLCSTFTFRPLAYKRNRGFSNPRTSRDWIECGL